MKHYLLSVWLIVSAIFLAGSISIISSFADDVLVNGLEVPQKSNESILGIQKINLPPASANLTPPTLTAKSVLVEDLGTGTIIYQKDASQRLPIASTTKIMTALVASEYFQPNSVLTVESDNIPGSKVGLMVGENLTLRSLLYGLLLNSGNDAAYALAENYPGGLLNFISAMNKKAAELGLNNTHFDNPAGFDNPSHYSSAYDLAKMSKEAIKNSQLSRIFATKQTLVVSVDQKYHHQLLNLNKLLSEIPGVLGVKTGKTDLAKENFVGLVERDGHRILTVVLGSDDRFRETTKLIDWTYSNFTWPKDIGQ